MRMPPLAPMPLIVSADNDSVAPCSWRAGCLRASREAIDDAHAVLAFLHAGMRSRAIDPAQTLWVVDLAPGDGERAWRVLRELASVAPRGPEIRYLAVCLGEAHRASLAVHPRLVPLVVEGVLYIDRDGCGLPLHPVRNPMVVLAHGAFSSRAQAAYAWRGGAWMEWDGKASAWSRVRRGDGFLRLLPAGRSLPDDTVLHVPMETISLISGLVRASEGRMLLRGSDVAFEMGEAVVGFDILARWHRAHGANVHQGMHGRRRSRILHLALHEGGDGALRECLSGLMSLPHPDEHADFLCALDAITVLPFADWPPLLRASGFDPRALRIALRSSAARVDAQDPEFLEAALACMSNAFDLDAATDASSGAIIPADSGLSPATMKE